MRPRERKPARARANRPGSEEPAVADERQELRRRQAELDQKPLPEARDGLVISPRGPVQPDADRRK